MPVLINCSWCHTYIETKFLFAFQGNLVTHFTAFVPVKMHFCFNTVLFGFLKCCPNHKFRELRPLPLQNFTRSFFSNVKKQKFSVYVILKIPLHVKQSKYNKKNCYYCIKLLKQFMLTLWLGRGCCCYCGADRRGGECG